MQMRMLLLFTSTVKVVVSISSALKRLYSAETADENDDEEKTLHSMTLLLCKWFQCRSDLERERAWLSTAAGQRTNE